MDKERDILKTNSTAHSLATRFFPKKMRRDVIRLYSFVRVADNYADADPPEPKKLQALETLYKKALSEQHFDTITHQWDEVDVRVVKNIVHVSNRYKFDPAWIDAFFNSMKKDVASKHPKTLDESLAYVYGAAEVIGLMMARILRIDKERELPDTPKKKDIKKDKLKFVKQASQYTVKRLQPDPKLKDLSDADINNIEQAAKMQARAMMWIYAIRDIGEDSKLGRSHFPASDLKKCGLKDLSEESAEAKPEAFKKFVALQIDRYRQWQAEADKGRKYIPRRLRIPLQTAADMGEWTAKKISKNPLVVYHHKVEPRKNKVLRRAVKNSARLKK